VKNPGQFVEAAAVVCSRRPDVRFTVAGEGPLRGQLERRITQLGIGGRVHLLGRVADVPGYLSRLDVAVLCSLSEGMSNAVLEYMAAGKAVVATAVGANPELIEDGVTGLLVPPNDANALAGAVQRLVDEPGLRARLGAAARDHVRQHFSRERAVTRYQELYYQLVRG
jgi:glycosyltransferase involved in cell wall biosynthesis